MKAPTFLNTATLKSPFLPLVKNQWYPLGAGLKTANQSAKVMHLLISYLADICGIYFQNLDLGGQLLLWSPFLQYFLHRETISSNSQC